MMSFRIVLVAWWVASLCAGGVGAVEPDPTMDWPSFRQNASLTGVATSGLPDALELLWETTTGDQVQASAAIVGDFVYVPSLVGKICCLERATGREVWAYQSVEVVEANSFAPGFKSSPTVTADTVYAGDEEGVFHAMDVVTGKKRWTFEAKGEIYSSAAVVDDAVLFGAYDNCLYCLDAATGALRWKYETQGYVHCMPAVAGPYTFIAGCDEHLRKIDIKTGKQVSELPLKTYLIASPAVYGDFLYVGTYGSEVVCVNWKTDEIVWRYKDEAKDLPFHSSAAVTNAVVVVGGRDKLVHAIDRATGKKKWTFPTRARIDSSPVLVGNRVFVGSSDGNLYEIDLNTGKERWKFNTGKAITAGAAVGRGVLVIGNESREGKVFCFGAKK